MFDVVFANSLYLLLSTFVIFVFFVLLFYCGYVFLHHYQLQNITYHKEKRIIGAQNYIHAFKISDSLGELKLIEAKNDLLIQKMWGNDYPKWMSFSQDRSLQRQFPDGANHWDDFQDTMTLGVSPKEMVENRFQKYGAVVFKIENYHDNSIVSIFPFQVLQEFYQLDVQGTNNKIAELYQASPNNNVHLDLVSVATKLKDKLFDNRNQSDLFSLRQLLMETTDTIGINSSEKEKIKNVIYGQVLSTIGTYQVQIKFDFSFMGFQPFHSDLFYLSLMNSTSNPPQDIVPVIGVTKFLCWLQVTISYFLLAFIVAVLLKILKIS